jgi:YVTN family beta-propeller protein
MSVRRASQLAFVSLSVLIWIACGQIYRPVVIPINITQPTPANFHSVIALNSNGSYDLTPPITPPTPTFSYGAGTAMQIDVSGDTIVGATPTSPTPQSIGLNPTHVAILSNHTRVFIASAGSFQPGGSDQVAAFTPVSSSTTATGFGAITLFGLPPGSLPDFVTSSSQTNAVYVANFGTNTVSVISLVSSGVINTVPTGVGPVAMAAAITENNTKLYVANEGDSSISSFNAVDMSQNTVTGFSGTTPVWIVSRQDGQKVFVITQGDGKLWTIDTATDSVSSSFSVGAGANYVYYEPNSQRLYVTNPATSLLYIFSSSGGAGDTPSLITTISIAGAAVSGNYPSCASLCPVTVAATPDGTRAYVGSYQLTSCSDPTFSTSCLVTPQLTVIDSQANTVKTTIYPLSLAQSGTPLSVPESFDCIARTPYSPAGVPVPGSSTLGLSARFRMSAAVAADSTKAYVSVCDSGSVGVVNTAANNNSTGGNNTGDTLVNVLAAPFGSGFPQSTTGQPAPQNTIFLLTAQ